MRVTAEQAAELWGVKERTVINYCKNELIPYTLENDIYTLDAEQKRPLGYIIKCKKYKTEHIRHYILSAINNDKYVNHTYFKCGQERFSNIVEDLVKEGRLNKHGERFPNNYSITSDGVSELYMYKRYLVNGSYTLIMVVGTAIGVAK